MELINIRGIDIEVSSNNIKIYNSFRVTDDEEKIKVIRELFNLYPEFTKYGRNYQSMLNEWKSHNILFQRNIKVNSTKDVDFEMKQNILFKIGYWFIAHFMRERKY